MDTLTTVPVTDLFATSILAPTGWRCRSQSTSTMRVVIVEPNGFGGPSGESLLISETALPPSATSLSFPSDNSILDDSTDTVTRGPRSTTIAFLCRPIPSLQDSVYRVAVTYDSALSLDREFELRPIVEDLKRQYSDPPTHVASYPRIELIATSSNLVCSLRLTSPVYNNNNNNSNVIPQTTFPMMRSLQRATVWCWVQTNTTTQRSCSDGGDGVRAPSDTQLIPLVYGELETTKRYGSIEEFTVLLLPLLSSGCTLTRADWSQHTSTTTTATSGETTANFNQLRERQPPHVVLLRCEETESTSSNRTYFVMLSTPRIGSACCPVFLCQSVDVLCALRFATLGPRAPNAATVTRRITCGVGLTQNHLNLAWGGGGSALCVQQRLCSNRSLDDWRLEIRQEGVQSSFVMRRTHDVRTAEQYITYLTEEFCATPGVTEVERRSLRVGTLAWLSEAAAGVVGGKKSSSRVGKARWEFQGQMWFAAAKSVPGTDALFVVVGTSELGEQCPPEAIVQWAE